MNVASEHIQDDRGHRDQFIPVRKADVLKALQDGHELSGDQQEKFRQVCQLLASIFHYEYFEQLERLRDGYHYFNPELDDQIQFDADLIEREYGELSDALTKVLAGANFVELSEAEIEEANRQRPFFRVQVRAPVNDFRQVRFFRRGRHKTVVRIRKWLGLYRPRFEDDVYDDVVLMVALKPRSAATARELRHLANRGIRPGSVFLKYFRNIGSTDLATLFPNVSVVMSKFDKMLIGLPAIVGGAPLVIKVVATIPILIGVLGLSVGLSTTALVGLLGSYRDLPSALQSTELRSALTSVGALVALGGFLMTQWVKYERKSLKYQKQITDNVYFHNINNNAGIFDYIIGAAEEQECKEAFLAYFFLLTAQEPPDQAQLDARIEAWLTQAFGIDIDFEVDDALAKLDRLQVLRRDGGTLSVLGLDDALARLDHRWDNFFRFNQAVA